MVQWLGHGAFTAKGLGSGPGQGTKIPQTTPPGQKKKKKNSELISAVNLLPQACYSLVSGHLHALHTVVLCLIPSEPGLLSSMEIEPFLEP